MYILWLVCKWLSSGVSGFGLDYLPSASSSSVAENNSWHQGAPTSSWAAQDMPMEDSSTVLLDSFKVAIVVFSTQSQSSNHRCATTYFVSCLVFFFFVLKFLQPLFLQSIWSSSMMQPGPSALEQLLMQQKQKQQRGHGNMNPPHWEPTGRRTCVKHDSTEEVKHHKLQSEISGIICARRPETANDVKRQAQNEPLAWPTRDVQPSPLLSLSHSLCLSPCASMASRACKHLTCHAAQHVAAAEHWLWGDKTLSDCHLASSGGQRSLSCLIWT